jgi:SAM-dependent methyltransferase
MSRGHFAARLIRASVLVDRCFSRYQQLRSLIVTALASDAVLQAYNDQAYSETPTYDAGKREFRESLFNWEKEFVDAVFPPPPARVLIGASGGGREAFQLADRGYQVVAFDPSEGLLRSMIQRAAQTGARVESLLGRYEDLPVLRLEGTNQSVDLRRLPRFDASILGWSSFSHIRASRDRVATLKNFAAVTDGPVVFSFFRRRGDPQRMLRLRRFLNSLGRRHEGDAFSPLGFFHYSSDNELAQEIREAGLRLIDASMDESDGHWPWMAVARPDVTVNSRSATQFSDRETASSRA